jgi:hypothetical protein
MSSEINMRCGITDMEKQTYGWRKICKQYRRGDLRQGNGNLDVHYAH